MSVPFRKRLQRYLRVAADNMFTTPAFRTALDKGIKATPVAAFPADVSKAKSIFACAASDETTPFAAGGAVTTFMAPYGFQIKGIEASLTTPQTSGSIVTVDVNVDGVSILSTLITFDNGTVSTQKTGTPPVLSTTGVNIGSEITIDIDQIGDGTATGLKVYLVIEI